MPPELRDEKYYNDPSTYLEIEFGDVIFGENCVRDLTIVNSGVLAAGFIFRPCLPSDEPQKPVERQNELRHSRIQANQESCESADAAAQCVGGTHEQVKLSDMIETKEKGTFPALATDRIPLKFTPSEKGSYETKYVLVVDNDAPGDARFKKTYYVKITGTCVPVPLYLEKEIYNLHTIVFDHIFRDKVILYNRRAVTMKIKVEKPSTSTSDGKLKPGEIQINPKEAFVQGNGGSIPVHFKF